MGKHEIRIRRQRMAARGSERFRNYGAILKQHEDEKRIKKIIRVFTYFVIIVALITMLVLVYRYEQKTEPVQPVSKSYNTSQ